LRSHTKDRPFSRLLPHTWGSGGPILTQILTGKIKVGNSKIKTGNFEIKVGNFKIKLGKSKIKRNSKINLGNSKINLGKSLDAVLLNS
jgi:hypothetical protein